MQIILRNFLITLKRFKLATTLNILGLSVAFAAFIIIMTQVHYENSFDTYYEKTGRIYRVEYSEASDSSLYYPVFPPSLIELICSSIPQIETYGAKLIVDIPRYIIYENIDGSLNGMRDNIQLIQPSIVKIFDFDMVEGSADALEEPDKFLIPESLAKKMFGDSLATGRRISFGSDSVKGYIGGVYRDFPANSSIGNNIKIYEKNAMQGWQNTNSYLFVVLLPGTSPAEVGAMLDEALEKGEAPEGFKKRKFRLTPVEDVYYQKGVMFDFMPKGNRVATNILFTVAFLIIAIAAINFVNFSTSLAPVRIKSVNTRKVLGESMLSLRGAFLFEAVGMCAVSFATALMWVYLFNIAGLYSILSTKVDFASNSGIILSTLALALLLGLVSGIYPAFYMTSFQPALALKGSFGLSPSGRRLRMALIGFQFIISIVLITSSLFLYLQNRYMRNFDSGMDTDQIAILEMDIDMARNSSELLAEKWISSPFIADVSFAQGRIGLNNIYSYKNSDLLDGRYMEWHESAVSYNFPGMMGLQIVDGRGFEKSDEEISESPAFIINETGARKNEVKVGDLVQNRNNARIVGIVKDFNFMDLSRSIEPMILTVEKPGTGGVREVPLYAYIRTKGDAVQAVRHIKNAISEVDPLYPTEITFYDQAFDQAYRKAQETSKQIALLSILAILISLVGVFGLVIFETQYRRKEIGLRKIHGATVNQILGMFNKNFAIIVGICFVIAVPLAYIGVSDWLGNFAYRVSLSWWVFALAGTITLIITLLTVTVQSWLAATDNPVNSIKNE